jgi:predicted MFS family arabinose efflux permease
MMVAGGVGALLATSPLEFALRFVHWRTVFVALAAATGAVALWIWWRVPDTPKPTQTAGLGAQWAGVRLVFKTPRFWWLAPLAGLAMGAFMAIQGLWSVPWMMQVQGLDRASAARHLLLMGVVTLLGYVLLGTFATRLARDGIYARHLFAAGFGLNVLGLGTILVGLPGSYLWWSLYGLGAAVNVLGFTVLNDGFARELAGRANTALNLVMFTVSFAVQWGIGVMIDLAHRALGFDDVNGLKLAFTVIFVLEAAAFAWFAAGWRQHARSPLDITSASI